MRIAYALRAEYRDNYVGGVLATGTSSIDVGAELANNDGLVLVSEHDHLALAVLDTYPALERTGQRPDAAPTKTPAGEQTPTPTAEDSPATAPAGEDTPPATDTAAAAVEGSSAARPSRETTTTSRER